MAVIKEVQQFQGLCRRRARRSSGETPSAPVNLLRFSAIALQQHCSVSNLETNDAAGGGKVFIFLLRTSFLHSTTLPEKHFWRVVDVTVKYTNVGNVEMMVIIIISPTARMFSVERR